MEKSNVVYRCSRCGESHGPKHPKTTVVDRFPCKRDEGDPFHDWQKGRWVSDEEWAKIEKDLEQAYFAYQAATQTRPEYL